MLTGDQKAEHCGVLDQQRDPTRVTTLRPGETITVTWMETINHPGHFRIAFQPNGSLFTIPAATAGNCGVACPAGITNCNYPTANQEGIDATTGSIVLKDFVADGLLSQQITLPDIECSNCTLQFFQLMTDKCPYTTDLASDDIYFNCADITLSNTAPMVDAGTSGMPDAPMDSGNGTSGGCSTGGGAGLVVGLSLLGLVTRRRRN